MPILELAIVFDTTIAEVQEAVAKLHDPVPLRPKAPKPNSSRSKAYWPVAGGHTLADVEWLAEVFERGMSVDIIAHVACVSVSAAQAAVDKLQPSPVRRSAV